MSKSVALLKFPHEVFKRNALISARHISKGFADSLNVTAKKVLGGVCRLPIFCWLFLHVLDAPVEV